MSSTIGEILSAPILIARTMFADAGEKEYRFKTGFRIGRSEDCEISINNEFVSRVHAEARFENGAWCIRDLNSSNGLYVGEQRLPQFSITGNVVVRLGIRGPEISFAILQPPPPPPQLRPRPEATVSNYAERYFGKSVDLSNAGEHTMLIRTAYAQVQKKQKHRYGGIIVALAVLIACVGGYAFYEHQQVKKQRALATDLFYSMKTLDLDVATLQQSVQTSGTPEALATIKNFQDRRQQMESNYDHFLATLHVYDPKMSEQDRLILKVARIFGECELDMPPDFSSEVNKYIKYWKSSDRLQKAVTRAKQNGYTQTITKALLSKGLPPQFFYLALQESDFDPYISGPATSYGIAKGMWQFIPGTAVKYGLHLGPLVELRLPDPRDERHNYQRESMAAGSYLSDLYATDAQASGLLVMACYNLGENHVIHIVRSMPLNPKERNYWMLLQKHRAEIPQETYDYVFKIVAAAVIGENPRLFGFNFDNPLADVECK